MDSSFEQVPRPSVWRRLLLGSGLIVLAAAGATSVTAFHEVDKITGALRGPDLELGPNLEEAAPGKPQTIMLLGSDKRPRDATDGGAGSGARSDTIILVRLDPERKATALMSLPRDLKVQIPGHGTDRLNAAYSLGGPKLALKTVKLLTGLAVNHVINVDFRGFQKAIDAIGCVYADIDRRYYNDSSGYAYININPGYQKLCGEKALQYSRFRHEDTDLVRAARQQDILREVKQQVGTGQLIEDRDRLYRIFGRYTTSDAELKTRKGLLRLLKLALFSVSNPIREVQFDKYEFTGSAGGPSYVTASDAHIKRLARRFLGVEDRARAHRAARRKRRRDPSDGGLYRDPGSGQAQALALIEQGAGKRLPIYYPTVLVKGSSYVDAPFRYRLRTRDGKVRQAYRIVISKGLIGEYYGLQGTTWKDPPILDGPSNERRFGKRRFEVHFDGRRVRLVAWRTGRAVYWVANTLLQTLTERQMLTIARTTRLP